MTRNSVNRDIVEVDDDRLAEAGRIAEVTGILTPLVKEELKYTILSRREADGKSHLNVTFEPPNQYELTPEEKLKVQRRREQNRNAARRFRQKQKEISHYSVKKIQSLETSNTALKTELSKLRKEKDELQREYHAHLLHCPTLGLQNLHVTLEVPNTLK